MVASEHGAEPRWWRARSESRRALSESRGTANSSNRKTSRGRGEREREGRSGEGKLKESRSSLRFFFFLVFVADGLDEPKALEENKESGWDVSDKDEERDGRD